MRSRNLVKWKLYFFKKFVEEILWSESWRARRHALYAIHQ